MNTKPLNPKDIMGVDKCPLSTVPATVMMETGLGMMEGDRKYGRHNYRVVDVLASVYYDAAMRHLMLFWEGEDIDPDSGVGLHHVSKAISSLVVLRDAMIQGKLVDDRPPRAPKGWLIALNAKAKKMIELFPNRKEPYTHE